MALEPERPAARAVAALVLVALGRLDAAEALARSAADAAPQVPGYRHLCTAVALRQGRCEAALTHVRQALARDAHDQRALADLAWLQRQGCPGADTSPPLADLVQVLQVAALETTASALNPALAAAICSHGDLAPSRPDTPLASGVRLADVFDLPPALADPLRAALKAAVRTYRRTRALPDGHPVATGAPTRLELVGWANVMTRGGHERAHIHQAGWLSGVYYVETPGAGPLGGGALQLGGHDLPITGAAPVASLQPRAGELVLFPSYLHHSTTPVVGDGRRISIAFDVLR